MDIIGISIGVGAIVATFTGPIIALQIQRKLDRERAARDRKTAIFRTLMALRMQSLNPQYVEALNLIDIEFCGNDEKEKTVRRDWKILLDHFFDLSETNNPDSEPMRQKTAELMTKLLISMGISLGYDFDEVQVKKGGYYPKGHGDVELEQHALRRALLHVLAGDSSLPVRLIEEVPSTPIGLSNEIARVPLRRD